MPTDTAAYAPLFPYFGGKSRIAHEVWARFGDVKNYVEPFFGSGAVLFMRPDEHTGFIETVNDKNGFVSNFWRALRADPDAVADYADWPVNENDLHARHAWLVGQMDTMQARLEGDPDWYDAKIAGWWVWGACCWIKGGWCSGEGPWHAEDGLLVKTGSDCQGVNRQLPHLGSAGRGVNRQLPHLGDAGRGVNRKLPHLGSAGQGVNRQLPHLGDDGRGVNSKRDTRAQMQWFSSRLRRVRVCCGDWTRVTGPSVTTVNNGLTGVFLDPPYSAKANRDMRCYGRHDDGSVAHAVREWAIAHSDDPLMRIALCGYEGEHSMPEDWECHAWKTNGGYGSQGEGQARENKHRERVWFSPHCLTPDAGHVQAELAFAVHDSDAYGEELNGC